jgi:uncharacterized membrane protein HdeD (DUF308 family)
MTTTTATPVFSGLRSLHLIRAAVSLVWVALLVATSASLESPDEPSTAAALLLIGYPLWDALATLLGGRLTGTALDRIGTANVAIGLVATIAMAVAVLDTVGSSLLVFGLWALVSGALQLAVAVRRRRAVGAQWPMIISGGLSVLAGASIALSSGTDTSSLSTVAGYSAFGAFWFLVSAVLISARRRSTSAQAAA